MSKILFLDIDGVCNSAEYAERRFKETGKGGLLGIDPTLAARVRKIVKATNCDVVLSSTWRLYDKARHDVRRDVIGFIDVTPNLQAGEKNGIVKRGVEVQDWLDRHPDVEVYAILDDDSDFLEDQWLFKTTFKQGLTEQIAANVIAHLNSIDE
jgi:hypothetical protein